ncbi:hypothetical protein [Pukyongiella litopenaei]|nr:hypothetical protein [Pukyongiella litopenaei]
MIAFPAGVKVWIAGGVTDNVLARLPDMTASQVPTLLPWNWKPSEVRQTA